MKSSSVPVSNHPDGDVQLPEFKSFIFLLNNISETFGDQFYTIVNDQDGLNNYGRTPIGADFCEELISTQRQKTTSDFSIDGILSRTSVLLPEMLGFKEHLQNSSSPSPPVLTKCSPVDLPENGMFVALGDDSRASTGMKIGQKALPVGLGPIEDRSLVGGVRLHPQGYVCHRCGKTYCRRYVLKIHMRTHDGERPHVCGKCGKAFSDPSNMKKHMGTHDENKAGFRCGQCGRNFTRRRGLNSHVSTVHKTAC